MKQQAITLLLGAAALVSAPCGFAEEPATEVAAPASLTLSEGGAASIVLPGNPTTGFTWNLAGPLAEDSPVSVDISLTQPEEKDSGEPLCGAPSDTVVTFTGVHEGTATITLVYARPWESKAPLKSRTFIVTVTK